MYWDPLTDEQLDAMSDVEIAERARLVQTSRAGRRVGADPLTDPEKNALTERGEAVRAALAAVPLAEGERNLLVRRLRCRYPFDRDLPSRIAYWLETDRSMVHRILNRSGYGEGGARAGFQV